MPTKSIPLIRTLIQVTAIWIASDIGYYVLLPLLGLQPNYNLSPISISVYYAFWIAITVNVFWDVFREWRPVEYRHSIHLIFILSLIGLFLFAYFALPNLPSVVWTESWDPPDLLMANSWYFLPKAIEILLQQLLIAVLVLSFWTQKFSLRAISLWSMLLFGGVHLLLAFGGMPAFYVIRFTLSAMAFGYLFPYLILRLPNGFLYSYTLHWVYYAVTIIMAHTISPYAS